MFITAAAMPDQLKNENHFNVASFQVTINEDTNKAAAEPETNSEKGIWNLLLVNIFL